jgi:GTPase involved in cell partitioning and DNA repair
VLRNGGRGLRSRKKKLIPELGGISGAAGGAGSIFIQGKDNLELPAGTDSIEWVEVKIFTGPST